MKIFRKAINQEKKTIASNYLSLLFLQAANYLLPLIILPFLIRVLGTEKFGLVMFAQSLITFLIVFVDFGFNLSGTREVSLAREDEQKLSEIFSAIMIIKFALIGGAFLILVIVVNLFTRFSIDANVYYLSFGVVVGQALFPVWFFQGIEKMKFVTFINILAKLIFTLLVFILIRAESDYIYVPVYNSLGFIVAGILGLILCFKYIKFTVPSLSLMKRLLSESFSLFVSNFASSLCTSSNVFILGIFAGNTIAGIYSSMEKLILAIKNVYVPLYQALYPWISKQTYSKKVKTIKKMRPLILLVGVLITVFIILFGKTILSIIYNDKLILEYSNIFKILSFIAIFSGVHMLYLILYFPAIKKYKTRMTVLVFGGLFNLTLNLILVRLYGIFGTAFAVVTTELFLLIFASMYFKKHSKNTQEV